MDNLDVIQWERWRLQMNKISVLLLALCVSTLMGCASVTEPMRVGADTYEVNSQMSGNYPSWAEVKNLALNKANAHCDKQGKVMTVEKEDYSGARGWTPIEAHIKYKCIDSAR